MRLIVGLGNIGEKYDFTRHNLGFFILDQWQKKMRENNISCSPWASEKKLKATISEVLLKNKEKIILAKPETLMNNSGQAIIMIKNYYQVETNDIFIVHDDLDLLFGQIKFCDNSRAAGHRGVQSIFDNLNTQEIHRLRVGIKNELLEKIPAEKFVLNKFTPDEKKQLDKIAIEAIKIIEKWRS